MGFGLNLLNLISIILYIKNSETQQKEKETMRLM